MHRGHMETIFSEDLARRGVPVERSLQYIGQEDNKGSEYSLLAYVKNANSGVVEAIPT